MSEIRRYVVHYRHGNALWERWETDAYDASDAVMQWEVVRQYRGTRINQRGESEPVCSSALKVEPKEPEPIAVTGRKEGARENVLHALRYALSELVVSGQSRLIYDGLNRSIVVGFAAPSRQIADHIHEQCEIMLRMTQEGGMEP